MSKFTLFCYYIVIWIFLSSKSDESFSVDVNAKRIEAGNHNVQSQVELVSVQLEGVVDVPWHDALLTSIDLFQIAGQIDATATRWSIRFHNPNIVQQGSLPSGLDLAIAH